MVVRGSAVPDGDFTVTDWRFAGLPPRQRSLGSGASATTPGVAGGRKFVALVSGLGIGRPGGEPLGVSLLVDWLTGVLGSSEDNTRAAQVRLQSPFCNMLFLCHRLPAVILW